MSVVVCRSCAPALIASRKPADREPLVRTPSTASTRRCRRENPRSCKRKSVGNRAVPRVFCRACGTSPILLLIFPLPSPVAPSSSRNLPSSFPSTGHIIRFPSYPRLTLLFVLSFRFPSGPDALVIALHVKHHRRLVSLKLFSPLSLRQLPHVSENQLCCAHISFRVRARLERSLLLAAGEEAEGKTTWKKSEGKSATRLRAET